MRESLATIVSQLDEIGLTYEISKDRYVSSRIPTRLRGDLPVLIEVGERTAVVRAFIMRAPDRDADEVYRRALRRNLDGSAWSFAVASPWRRGQGRRPTRCSANCPCLSTRRTRG
jgi:hypothetical protein